MLFISSKHLQLRVLIGQQQETKLEIWIKKINLQKKLSKQPSGGVFSISCSFNSFESWGSLKTSTVTLENIVSLKLLGQTFFRTPLKGCIRRVFSCDVINGHY